MATTTSLNVTHLHHNLVFGTTTSTSSASSIGNSVPSSRSSSSTISDSGSSPGTSSAASDSGLFCKDCDLMFDSSSSLEVHLSYHKENLLSRWASQDPSNHNITTSHSVIAPPQHTPSSAPSPSIMEAKSQQLIGRPTGSPYYQSLAPVSLDQHGHYNGISASSPSPAGIYTRPIPSFPGYNNFPPQHLQQPMFPPMDTGDPPPRPPSNTRDQKDTPAEILDLDSNKVHIYHQLQQQQQQQQQQHQNFYRPYLMSQGPTNSWGGPNDSHPHFPPPPQHEPPSQVYPIMYEFMGEAPIQRYMSPNAEPHPQMGFNNNGPSQPPPPPHIQQPPGVQPSFRGSFPPQPEQIPSPHSPALIGSPTPAKKPGKKSTKNNNNGPPSITTMSEDGSPTGEIDSPAPKTKGWKGGECKRPKTYNCVACNKWFTSSGHLKRHYGTTLHKNSIKQRGENPDEVQPPPTPGRGKGKKQQQQQQQQQQQSQPPSESGDSSTNPGNNGNGMDIDPSVPVGTSPRNGMIKDEPGNGKSTPQFILQQSNGGNGLPAYLTQGPGSSPYGSSATPPSYIPFNGPPYNGSHPSSLPPTTQFLPVHPHHPFANGFGGTEPPNIYSVPSPIVPTTLYSTGPPFSHADLPGVTSSSLPPFSSVAGGAFTTAHHYDYGSPFPSPRHSNAPTAFLHQNSLGPPGGGGNNHSPPSYHHESSSSLENNNGPLNRSSPEAARSVSSASGHSLSVDGLEDELGSPVRNGSISSGDNSNSFENEFNSTTILAGSLDVSSTTNNNNNNDNNNSPIIQCPNCSKTFNRSCYLTQHTNSSHSGGKPFKCPKCGKRFLEEPALSDHVAKHGNDKPYKCELCPKQFNHKTDLRRHLCLHTGEKPFVCNICGKGFIRKDHMTKHCETHRKNKGQGQQQGQGTPVLAQ